MNQVIANLWANALENPKFKQTTGNLVKETRSGGHTFCATGVLCHILAAAGYLKRVKRNGILGYVDAGGRFSATGIPAGGLAAAGLTNPTIAVVGGVKVRARRGNHPTTISVLNDVGVTGDAWTFKSLAKLIRRRHAQLI